MLSVISEGFLFKKNPEFEKYCKLAAEAYARAHIEREVVQKKGYEVYSKSDIDNAVEQYTNELCEKFKKDLKQPEVRAYYRNLYPKDFEKELRANRWSSKEIQYMLKFLDYIKKAVKAYEDDSKWQ